MTAAWPGNIRAALEHRPRDPFKVDEGNAIDALRLRWSDAYLLETRNGMYQATRRQRPHKTLEAATPDGLTRLLLDDSRSW